MAFERLSEFGHAEVGSGIQLQSNALLALQRLDVAERIESLGVEIKRTLVRTRSGKALVDLPNEEIGRRLGAPSIGLTRTNLHRALREAVDEDWVALGRACTGFVQDAAGVTAQFSDGTEERGDVLIGADGLRSTIRTQVIGPQEPRYHFTTWRVIIDFEHELAPPEVLQAYWGRGNEFIIYGVAPGRLHWVAAMHTEQGPPPPVGTRRAILLERYQDYVAPVQELIEATEEGEIYPEDIFDRDIAKQWGQGRVTLLGDSAHPLQPNSGQGASLALEDAIVLAKTLDPENVAESLRAYEARRISRASAFLRQSRLVGRLGRMSNPVVCAVRDRLVRVASRGALRGSEKALAYEF